MTAKPPTPVTINPGEAYVHITSPLNPSAILSGISLPAYQLKYVGPVGELEGEHIFKVCSIGSDSAVVKRSELPDKEVLGAVKALEGVKGAKVLETKQRAKRDEF